MYSVARRWRFLVGAVADGFGVCIVTCAGIEGGNTRYWPLVAADVGRPCSVGERFLAGACGWPHPLVAVSQGLARACLIPPRRFLGHGRGRLASLAPEHPACAERCSERVPRSNVECGAAPVGDYVRGTPSTSLGKRTPAELGRPLCVSSRFPLSRACSSSPAFRQVCRRFAVCSFGARMLWPRGGLCGAANDSVAPRSFLTRPIMTGAEGAPTARLVDYRFRDWALRVAYCRSGHVLVLGDPKVLGRRRVSSCPSVGQGLRVAHRGNGLMPQPLLGGMLRTVAGDGGACRQIYQHGELRSLVGLPLLDSLLVAAHARSLPDACRLIHPRGELRWFAGLSRWEPLRVVSMAVGEVLTPDLMRWSCVGSSLRYRLLCPRGCGRLGWHNSPLDSRTPRCVDCAEIGHAWDLACFGSRITLCRPGSHAISKGTKSLAGLSAVGRVPRGLNGFKVAARLYFSWFGPPLLASRA